MVSGGPFRVAPAKLIYLAVERYSARQTAFSQTHSPSTGKKLQNGVNAKYQERFGLVLVVGGDLARG